MIELQQKILEAALSGESLCVSMYQGKMMVAREYARRMKALGHRVIFIGPDECRAAAGGRGADRGERWTD